MKLREYILAFAFFSAATLLISHFSEYARSPDLTRTFANYSDTALTTCILQWNLNSLKHTWDLPITEAPIFFPSKYAKFFSEHLFGHLIYAYPVSLLTSSPYWTYIWTFHLNLLTTAFAAFLLCRKLTSNFLASLAGGFLLITGRQFGQLQNTSLGWVILTMLLFLLHWENPKWKYAAGIALFAVMTGLCSDYLTFFTPVALAILIIVRMAVEKEKPGRVWLIQTLVALVFTIVALLPTMLQYKKVQKTFGVVRSHYVVGDYVLPFDLSSFSKLLGVDTSKGEEEEEASEIEPTQIEVYLTRTAVLQILVFLFGSFLLLTRRIPKNSWYYAFLILGLLTFWMSAFQLSPYWLLSHLPGFNGLRAAHRWSLIGSVALTVIDAAVLDYLLRKSRIVTAATVVVLIAVSLVTESMTERLNFFDTGLSSSHVYSFVQKLEPGPILNVPVVRRKRRIGRKIIALRMLYQLEHKHPMVSGRSGFSPPLNEIIEFEVTKYGFSPRIVQKLATTGVRYVVVDSFATDTDRICRQLRSLSDIKILYDQENEMVAQLPLAPVKTTIPELKQLWTSN